MNEENDGEKRLLVVFIAAVAVGATAALVFIFQFFGDAVRERSDLYISARTDYPGLLDSLRPRTATITGLSTGMPAAWSWSAPSNRGTTYWNRE